MRILILVFTGIACGDGGACDEPPSGWIEVVLVNGEERFCTLATDPTFRNSGSLETVCRGCEETYVTRDDFPNEDVAAIFLTADDDAYATGGPPDVLGTPARTEVVGQCGESFVGVVKTWGLCEGRSLDNPCPSPPDCVYDLVIERL